ncbi:MAG: MBL fold metallo-hydrolase [Proteobacteria bacterium]|nr:MBL fold metallo-hydrolase [Pseudomonadota bacterium]
MKSLGQRASGLRLERMQASPLWSGSGFRNGYPVRPDLRQGAMPPMGEILCPRGRQLPAGPLPAMSPLADWLRPPATGLRATWLGHSTVLVEIGGLRVLTDPVWGPRASPTRLAGPRRFQPVPLTVRELPPIDVVLISHDHYDHLDYPTIRELVRHQPQAQYVTTLGVGAHLEAWGVPPARIAELDWWQAWQAPGAELAIHAAPSQHFSGRALKDRNGTLWASFALVGAHHRVFFSGDTGLTDAYALIRERLGPFDLVMLEVGAFHPAWGDIHLGPAHALEAHALLGGGLLLPVHWGTFCLAVHDWDEPVETLLRLAPQHGAPLVLPRLGQTVEPPQVREQGRPPEPWWRAVQGSGVLPPEPEMAPLPKSVQWPLD